MLYFLHTVRIPLKKRASSRRGHIKEMAVVVNPITLNDESFLWEMLYGSLTMVKRWTPM